MSTASLLGAIRPYNIVLYICNHLSFLIHHTAEGNTANRIPSDFNETGRHITKKRV